MTSVIFIAFALTVLFVPSVTVLVLIVVWKKFDRRRRRRSPLTTEIGRLAGQSLRDQLDDISVDLMGYLTMTFFLPALLLCLYLLQIVWNGSQPTLGGAASYGVVIILALGFLVFQIISTVKKRQKLRDAADAEIATGQELEQLKAAGYRVFHDVQAGKFNIDHVAIGPAGVFAFETKSRLKPLHITGTNGSTVNFDGKRLKFPDWVETKPLDQARRQAKWLKARLAKSAGENVEVIPVLAFPGWFVERTGTSDVVVINSRNLGWILRSPVGLNDGQVQRIGFQLEQLARAEDNAVQR